MPLLLAGALLVAPGTARSQDLEVQRLAEGVHLLSGGADGNVLVVRGEPGTLLVDGRSPGQEAPLRAALDGLDAGPVRFVVDTHYHDDHVGTNAAWAAEGALLIAHRATREAMAAPFDVPRFGWHRDAAPPEAWPRLLVEERLTLRLGAHTVRLVHLPAAHTAGDLAVLLPEANVLHTGDVFEVGAYPFLDLWHGGSLHGLIAACDTLADLCDDQTRLVPGHGHVVDRPVLLVYRAMLASLRDEVQAAVDEGLDLQAWLDSEPTAPFDGRWGSARSGRFFAELIWLDATGER